ncbi:DUF1684 domain-containing protein [Frankia sp. AiPs1]|uniref:DUF1684 domain-containing protein n=1 Tax=Frankia sp. AiPa1 TaxID=573492 RepID=UPI00202B36C5|nr:DUF1684 domain-containing protein [Frankia sp. AiPa1]MCL9760512.1 DUF1684 domain-containing protein [Frankia sp. AiPa1]
MSEYHAGLSARPVDELQGEWYEFRRAWLDYLARPYGPLSPVGLYWLGEDPQTFDEIPGSWSVEGGRRIVVDASAQDRLTVDDQPIKDRTTLLDAAAPHAARPAWHDTVLVVPTLFPTQTGQAAQLGIQVHDPYVASRRLELGVPTYPYDPKWILPARYEPFPERRPVTLRSVVEGKIKDLSVFGRVSFVLDGNSYFLEVYAGPDYELHIPFRDRTSGHTTFAGARLVFAPQPKSAGGAAFDFELDFNRAVNGPCGFSPYTTCALPPPGNTLPVAIEAGEKLPLWMEQPSEWAR